MYSPERATLLCFSNGVLTEAGTTGLKLRPDATEMFGQVSPRALRAKGTKWYKIRKK